MITALILTYFNVNDSAAVHPHGKHGICEHHSDLIQQLLLQRGTVEFLGGGGSFSHAVMNDRIPFDVPPQQKLLYRLLKYSEFLLTSF